MRTLAPRPGARDERRWPTWRAVRRGPAGLERALIRWFTDANGELRMLSLLDNLATLSEAALAAELSGVARSWRLLES